MKGLPWKNNMILYVRNAEVPWFCVLRRKEKMPAINSMVAARFRSVGIYRICNMILG